MFFDLRRIFRNPRRQEVSDFAKTIHFTVEVSTNNGKNWSTERLTISKRIHEQIESEVDRRDRYANVRYYLNKFIGEESRLSVQYRNVQITN